MPKSLGDNSQGSNSRYWQSGVFTEKCEVISVEDFSNYPLKKVEKVRFESGFEPEICLRMMINNGGEDRKFNLFGQFQNKTDRVSGKVVKYLGWREKGNAVQNLIFKLGLGSNCLNEDDSIKADVLKKMVGMSFYKLRYCTGPGEGEYADKPQFKDWGIFENSSIEDGDQVLHKAWLKVSAYFTKYDPVFFDSWSDVNRKQEESFKPEDTIPDEAPM